MTDTYKYNGRMARPPVLSICGILAALLLWGAGLSPAKAQSGPAETGIAPDTHLGVVTCAGAGAGCHDAAAPGAPARGNVDQNEYAIWLREDPHSKAFAVLSNQQSRRIARNLGIKDATKAEMCLECHTDFVPPAKRGARFHLEDGVGCEACHGGSAGWIASHFAQSDHAVNVANGLFPTDDPIKRAGLCLNCHLGDQRRFVTHRIMGAGHPPLRFELDTFTAVQPAHYTIDDDYRKRKKVVDGVQTWAVGQAIAASRFLGLLLDAKTNPPGLFPELVFFDCGACHHSLTDLRWRARKGTGLGPGAVRLNDANFIMLRILAERLDPGLGQKLLRDTRALHRASAQGRAALIRAARRLKATTDSLAGRFAARSFSAGDMRALLAGLVAEGTAGEYFDYVAAEQATMALSAVVQAMRDAGHIDDARHKAFQSALDGCYAALEKRERYSPNLFLGRLKKVGAVADNI